MQRTAMRSSVWQAVDDIDTNCSRRLGRAWQGSAKRHHNRWCDALCSRTRRGMCIDVTVCTDAQTYAKTCWHPFRHDRSCPSRAWHMSGACPRTCLHTCLYAGALYDGTHQWPGGAWQGSGKRHHDRRSSPLCLGMRIDMCIDMCLAMLALFRSRPKAV